MSAPLLRSLGHAMVLVESASGERLLIDPCPDGALGGQLRYGALPQGVRWVVCTHAHGDHAGVSSVPGAPQLVERGSAGAFEVERVAAWHDEYGGRRRGGAVDMVVVEVDGWRIAHLSDVGQSPSTAQIEALGRVDVAVVPVGGFYTIGAAQAWEWAQRLGAGWVIPAHYKTERCGLGLRGVEVFEAWGGVAGRCGEEGMVLERGRSRGIWVVEGWGA
jgi:L-ascorbate metabolism protein UlaG (beta-lactamase superfamily)